MTQGTHVTAAVAAYAFSALDSGARREVEAHLADCADCAEAVALAQHCAALLALVVTPYRAPEGLRETLLREVAAPDCAAAGPESTAEEVPLPQEAEPPEPAPPLLEVPKSPRVTRAALLHFALVTAPWALAVLGWLAAAALFLFSRGQADRIDTTRKNDQVVISALTTQRDNALVVQDYLLTPGVTARPLTYQPGSAPHTNITLLSAPGYIHAVLAARGLVPLPTAKTYAVWAKVSAHRFVALGTLVTGGVRAEGVSLLVGPKPIDSYPEVGISIEYLPVGAQPHASLAFVIKQHPVPAS